MKHVVIAMLLMSSTAWGLIPVVKPSIDAHKTKKSLVHKASYEESVERYQGVYDVQAHTAAIIPKINTTHMDCTSIPNTYYLALGGMLPLEGKALDKQPGGMAIDYYVNCVGTILRDSLQDASVNKENMEFLFPPDDVKAIGTAYLGDATAAANFAATDILSMSLSSKTMATTLPIVMESIANDLVGPRDTWTAARLIGDKSVFTPASKTADEFIKYLIDTTTVKVKDKGDPDLLEVVVREILILRMATLKR